MRNALTKEEIEAGKTVLIAIVSMLVGLIKANDSGRFREDGSSYLGEGE